MKKFGLEKEVFLKKDDRLALVPASYPMDECGWLLELRTSPHTSVRDAIDELLLLEQKTYRSLKAKGYSIMEVPLAEIPKEIVRKALAEHGKGVPSYDNYLGHDFHKAKKGEQTASVHISITDQEEVRIPNVDYDLFISSAGKVKVEKVEKDPTIRVVNKSFNWLKYFLALDKAFEKEIEASSRVPGMYEFKADGRVEYRSLPNNIDLNKLSEVLESVEL